MQRSFLVPLILAAVAFGVYWERAPLMVFWRQASAKVSEKVAAVQTPAGAVPPPTAGDAPPTAATYDGPRAPGQPQKAAPGTFFMLERAKVVSSTGVKAVNPGELVKLLERRPHGRLRVTVGNADFEVSPEQVTDDLAAAQEAERRFHASSVQNL